MFLVLLFSIPAMLGLCYLGWKATVLIWTQEHPIFTSGKFLLAFFAFAWLLLMVSLLVLTYVSIIEVSSDFPLMVVNDQGVACRDWRGKLISWQDITDLQSSESNDGVFITFSVKYGSESWNRTRGWHNSDSLDRLFNFSEIAHKDRASMLAKLHQALDAYGNKHARAAVAKHELEIDSSEAFDVRLKHTMPQAWALYALMSILFGVWVTHLLNGNDLLEPGLVQLWRAGASSTALVKLNHEYWRLFTAIWVQHSLVDLQFHLVTLVFFGRLLNRLVGHVSFMLIYLGSAIIASALSLHFASTQTMVATASSGILGVCAALLSIILFHPENVPSLMRKQVLGGVTVCTGLIFFNAFKHPSNDIAANIAGMFTGFILGFFMSHRSDAPHTASANLRFHFWATACIVVFVVAFALIPSQPKFFPREWFAWQALQQQMQPRVDTAMSAIAKDIDSAERGQLTQQAYISKLQNTHIPALDSFLNELNSAPVPQADRMFKIVSSNRRMLEVQRLILENDLRSLHFSRRDSGQWMNPQLNDLHTELELLKNKMTAYRALNQ
jgi:rhomboid protease GluP